MTSHRRLRFYLLTVLLHIILLLSISDLYFTPHYEPRKTPQFTPLRPPAKRLVVFLADKASVSDIFSVDENDRRAHKGFLREVATVHGRWGVLHSHAYSQSYPAIFSGVDRKGFWLQREVNYDSLFNGAAYTWYWGGSVMDLVPGKAEWIEARAIGDDGVSNDLLYFFSESKKINKTLGAQLSNDKIVFVIKISSPSSVPALSRNSIDSQVKNISHIFQTFYEDHQTAFIFTSIQSERPSRAGDNDSVDKLPLLCWGAGVKKPKSSQNTNYHYKDGLAEKWKLSQYERIDVQQLDLAVLMATLIGVHIPVDSRGTIPADLIHYNKQFTANIMFANARQLLEIVKAKENKIISQSLPYLFRPFGKFTKEYREQLRVSIDNSIKDKKLQESIHMSRELISQCKDAIVYFEAYHQISLKIALALGWLGWITCAGIVLLRSVTLHPTLHSSSRMLFFSPVGLGLLGMVCVTQLYYRTPLMYCFYYSIPIACWDYVFTNRQLLWCAALKTNSQNLLTAVISGILLLCTAELVVVAFLYPKVLGLALIVLSIWPYLTTDLLQRGKWPLCLSWSSSCVAMGVYMLLPRLPRVVTVNLTGVVVIVGCLLIVCLPHLRYVLTTPQTGHFPYTLMLQTVMFALCLGVTAGPYLTVLVLFVMPMMLLASASTVLGRLLHILLLLASILLLTGPSSEIMFIFLLAAVLYSWLRLEEAVTTSQQSIATVWDGLVSYKKSKEVVTLVSTSNSNSELSYEDVRKVCFLVLFFAVSFLGAYQTTSSPTSALVSSVIPFLMVCCVYNVSFNLLNKSLKVISLLALIMLDTIILNLFLLIGDPSASYSAQEVSPSGIYLFVSVVAMVFVVPVLGVLACVLTGRSTVSRKIEEHSL